MTSLSGNWRHRLTQSALASGLFWFTIGVSGLADLMTKRWAASRFIVGVPWPTPRLPRFVLAYNANLNLGLRIPGGTPLVYTVAGLLVMGLALWIASHIPRSASAYVLAIALTLGGGAGNVLERAVRGRVTDFINFGLGSFNVADVVGCAGVLLYLVIRTRDGVREEGWRRTLLTSQSSAAFLPPSLRRVTPE